MNPISPRDPRIQIAIDFMSANLHQRFLVSELAVLTNLSARQFSRLFRDQTGRSPGKYLRTLRMDRASRLLATTLMSVKQVMAMVGYTDKSDFTRDFRVAFGLTPSAYRQNFLDVIVLKDRLLRNQRKI